MTHAFNVGDRVRCINPGGNASLATEGEYKVTRAARIANTDVVYLNDGASYYFAHRFELIKEEPVTQTKFKVGDTVECIDALAASASLTLGKTYTVTKVDNVRAGYIDETIFVINDQGVDGRAFARRFKLAATVDTIDIYDERLLPLFTKAARLAEEKGYCREYDVIAKALGAPSREEIKALTPSQAKLDWDAMPVGTQFQGKNTSYPDNWLVKLNDDLFYNPRRGDNFEPSVQGSFTNRAWRDGLNIKTNG